MDTSTENILNVRAAAQRLGVHENTVRNYVQKGRLSDVREPGASYIKLSADEVDEVARERRHDKDARTRIGGNPEFVDASFLDSWSGRRAQEILPEVVAKLLAATDGIVGLAMPYGESIGNQGWDGQVEDSRGNPWVPPGRSRWELGTERDPKKKANEDYAKRSKDPLGVKPATTAFVFVTPRRWPGAREWEAERRAEGIWADVSVIESERLAAWLGAHPAIHLWLSEKVGLQPREVRSLDGFWERFRARTEPPLSTKLVLAGRQTVAEGFVEKLVAPQPQALAIGAGSLAEGLAFIAAAIKEGTKKRSLRPAVIAESARGWDRLATAQAPMTIIVATDDMVEIGQAVSSGHHVVLLLTGNETTSLETIDLPPLDRSAVADELRHIGVEFDSAYRLAGLARRSFAALTRDSAIAVGARSAPPWAAAENARTLGRLMLAGAWSGSDADRGLVAALVDSDWSTVEDELVRWQRSDDPPFIQAASTWRLTSPEEAFALFSPSLRQRDLEGFAKVTKSVFREIDPALELPTEERPYAGIHGASRTYSGTLRRGIAEGLAMLATFADGDIDGGPSGADFAAHVVDEVLKSADEDAGGLKWRSLSDQLPLLAEAAPDIFLKHVAADLGKDQPLLGTLFEDRDDTDVFFSQSAHTGLLWALETLAWSPEYLSRVALALARLAEIDPGGRLSNRPAASLRAIFLPWIPYTSAPLEQRLTVLSLLANRHADVAWQLLVALLPKTHDISMPSHAPRFRDWRPERERATYADLNEAYPAIGKLVAGLAGRDHARWLRLIDAFSGLAPSERELFFAGLEALEPDPNQAEAQRTLWQGLVDEIGNHRSFPDAEWSLDDASLDRLSKIAGSLEPTDQVERHGRLFTWNPTLEGGNVDPHDFEAQQAAADRAREQVVTDTLAAEGVGGLVRIARVSTLPDQVGVTAARVQEETLTEEMIALLGTEPAADQVARGWVRYLSRENGRAWIEDVAEELRDWTVDQQVSFLLEVPIAEVWPLLDFANTAAVDGYWQHMEPYRAAAVDLERVIRRLLAHKRPFSAMTLLTMACRRDEEGDSLEIELVTDVLDAVVAADSTDDLRRSGSTGYEIGVLLDFLEEAGLDGTALALYEFRLFPALDHQRQPRALMTAIANDPDFFVELVSLVYRGDDQARRELTEQETQTASNAWSVLNAFRQVPGADDKGVIDGEKMRRWVRKARGLLAERKRSKIGDQEIGQVLSAAAAGKDGVWPPEPVRELVEDLASDDLETGFEVGRFNSVGVQSRAIHAGGNIERKRSAQYAGWAEAVIDEWPRSGAMLHRLGRTYDRHARDEDRRADIDATSD